MNTTEVQQTIDPDTHDTERLMRRPADDGEASEKTSELARHRDPSQAPTKTPGSVRQRRGLAWVRPSDLIGQATARVAGRGLDFHAELARRTRRPAVQASEVSRRVISDRARRLPPVTAFGRHGHTHAVGAVRSGIGQN
jgi:hypothetical protein